MLGIKQINVDGSVIDLKRQRLTLAQMQRIVATGSKEALIEYVGPYRNEAGGQVMVVNEEGLLRHLQLNAGASEIAGRPIVGDVFIGEFEESDFSSEEDDDEDE